MRDTIDQRMAAGLVELDCLAAFDCLQWLRTGERAALAVGCSQSTVSRSSKKCEEAFQIQLRKREAEWQVIGDSTLLNAERRVHQRYRWSTHLPLRLESQHWLQPSYADLALPGWHKGNFNFLEYTRPLQLLRDGVIDAWLCSAPDHPQADDLTSIQLCRMPTFLMVRTNHPLLKRPSPLSPDDVKPYPVALFPSGAFPVFEKQLAALGFHSDFSGLAATAAQDDHDPQCIEDLAISIGSPLALPLYDNAWVQLPLTLPITMGDSLVVRREFATHRRTNELVQRLCRRLRAMVGDRNDVELIHETAGDRLG